MNIPILGQGETQKPRTLLCVLCKGIVQETNGGLVCLNEKCSRFGLISITAKDPSLEGKTMEELGNPKKIGGEGESVHEG